jgi:hypothetical protein
VKGLLGVDADRAGAGSSFVFLVATKDSARAIWPQIQAAGGLPTIATSLVYNGESDPAVDNALAGLQFVDIPWMLSDGGGPLSRLALARTQPRIGGSDQRLYAMGIDAYRMAPRATDLARRPGSFFPGQTGALRIDSTGHVHRQLVLGQFTAQGVLLAKTAGAGTAR